MLDRRPDPAHIIHSCRHWPIFTPKTSSKISYQPPLCQKEPCKSDIAKLLSARPHFEGVRVPFDASHKGSDWILMKCGRWLDGPYWSGGFLWGANVSRDNEGGGERGFIKEHKQEPRPLRRRLQARTRPSLFNWERKVISHSIILHVGGNSEQMATMVTGLNAIGARRGRLFFGTNLPWPHEVFIEHGEVELGSRSIALQTGLRSKAAECLM